MQKALLPLLLAIITLGAAENDDFLTFWPENYPTFESPTVPRALFVTSWNSHGRKAAINHASKFSTVILCLYDLRFDQKQFRLQKLVEIEPSFMKDLRAANPSITIILRIYVVGSARSLFEYVGSSTKKIAEVAAGIIRAMRKEKANGIYFDSPFSLSTKSTETGPYDKFAGLLNNYIANKVKELMWQEEKLYFGVRFGAGESIITQVDLTSLKTLKVDGIMVEALDSQADVLLLNALGLIKQLRNGMEENKMEFYVAVPLCSWRNGIGVKTSTVKENLQKNGISYRGFKNGLCFYVQRVGGAESIVPCEYYFQIVRSYAYEMGVKLAFFQAGDAVQKQFQMI